MAVHVLDKTIEHRNGVVDDGLVADIRAVQQPASELQFGIQHGALGDPWVAALAGGGVCSDGGLSGLPR